MCVGYDDVGWAGCIFSVDSWRLEKMIADVVYIASVLTHH